MSKVLVVVDMQNDFIDGSLGTPEARKIVPKVVEKIRNWDGKVVFTMDTHGEDYLNTIEGKHLPVKHCVINTYGWQINDDVYRALREKNAVCEMKSTFGDPSLSFLIEEDGLEYVEFVGLCTDICVITNALIVKSDFDNVEIGVDSSCCSGSSRLAHQAALTVMQNCHINVV